MSAEFLKTGEPLKAQWPLGRTLTLSLALLVALAVGAGVFWSQRNKDTVIRLGILHAQTGPMAVSEKPMIEAELMAIDEINAAGGVMGMKIEEIHMKTDLLRPALGIGQFANRDRHLLDAVLDGRKIQFKQRVSHCGDTMNEDLGRRPVKCRFKDPPAGSPERFSGPEELDLV